MPISSYIFIVKNSNNSLDFLNRFQSLFCSYPGPGDPVGDNSSAELSDSRLKQFQRHQCAQVTRARHRHGGEQKSQSYRPQVRHNQN